MSELTPQGEEPGVQARILSSLIGLMKRHILEDIEDEVVPDTVASFSELHNYVDANCYGHLCDDATANDYIKELGGRAEGDDGILPQAYLDVLNAAQTAIDVWLKEGRNG